MHSMLAVSIDYNWIMVEGRRSLSASAHSATIWLSLSWLGSLSWLPCFSSWLQCFSSWLPCCWRASRGQLSALRMIWRTWGQLKWTLRVEPARLHQLKKRLSSSSIQSPSVSTRVRLCLTQARILGLASRAGRKLPKKQSTSPAWPGLGSPFSRTHTLSHCRKVSSITSRLRASPYRASPRVDRPQMPQEAMYAQTLAQSWLDSLLRHSFISSAVKLNFEARSLFANKLSALIVRYSSLISASPPPRFPAFFGTSPPSDLLVGPSASEEDLSARSSPFSLSSFSSSSASISPSCSSCGCGCGCWCCGCSNCSDYGDWWGWWSDLGCCGSVVSSGMWMGARRSPGSGGKRGMHLQVQKMREVGVMTTRKLARVCAWVSRAWSSISCWEGKLSRQWHWNQVLVCAPSLLELLIFQLQYSPPSYYILAHPARQTRQPSLSNEAGQDGGGIA